MSSELRVTDYKGGKLIRLSSPFDSRAKTLDFFYSLIYLVPMLVILIVVMSDNDSFPDLIANIFTIPGLFALIGFMVSTIVFLKFFRRATAIEELYINKQELQIIQKLFPRTVVQAFDITDIFTNVLGGVIGSLIFEAIEKLFNNSVKSRKFITLIAAIGTVLMISLLLLLKLNMLPIRYQ